jgi:hypothetical protein
MQNTIFVSETSEPDIFFQKGALAQGGVECRIHAITNGADAREWITDAQPNGIRHGLIPLYLNLLELDGFDLLAPIRESRA